MNKKVKTVKKQLYKVKKTTLQSEKTALQSEITVETALQKSYSTRFDKGKIDLNY